MRNYGRVIKDASELDIDGLILSERGHRGDCRPEVVEAARAWINRNCRLSRTYSKRASYGWKMMVESELGIDLDNGEFICAALAAGVPCRESFYGSPNVVLKLDVRLDRARDLGAQAKRMLGIEDRGR